MIFFPSYTNRRVTLLISALLVATIAVADWLVDAEVPLGFLYLLPIVVASGLLGRRQIVLLGAGCTVLAEAFDAFHWSPWSGIPRDLLYFAAFSGVGLFAREIAAARRVALDHVHELEAENRARRDAEEQLKILVESSPVAILTADGIGCVLLANDAAHRLFELPAGSLVGQSIRAYLPSLLNVPALRTGQQSFRTVMQCKGYRLGGEVFMADVWFSTYRTSAGPRLAVMVVDASEDLRDREETGLHQLLADSRILVGAVSHEIRNVCGAIAVVHENLLRSGSFRENKDFEALGTLVLALGRIAAMELRPTASQTTNLELGAFFEELKIVIGPPFRDQAIALHWMIAPDLPTVHADRHSLMQVLLNLTKNSERALAGHPHPRLTVTAREDKVRVLIIVKDNGRGVANPDRLFTSFQYNAQETGLGLYLSRALMRSFGGDLRYERGDEGATFVVELAPTETGNHETYGAKDSAVADRRS